MSIPAHPSRQWPIRMRLLGLKTSDWKAVAVARACDTGASSLNSARSRRQTPTGSVSSVARVPLFCTHHS
eukprot:5179945-Pleurochrysis_carterae.AAC.1